MTMHDAQIKTIAQLIEQRVVGIDDGDVVLLACQIVSQGCPDLACTENDDFQCDEGSLCTRA